MGLWKTLSQRLLPGLPGRSDHPPKACAPVDARPSRLRTGAAAEDAALAFLQQQGLRLLQRNYRTPGRGGGEIDLILRDTDGTLVFVEVRARTHSDFGGAGASIDARKQRRIVLAAQHFLLSWRGSPPPCRFDVVLIDGAPGHPPQWLQAAFDAG